MVLMVLLVQVEHLVQVEVQVLREVVVVLALLVHQVPMEVVEHQVLQGLVEV